MLVPTLFFVSVLIFSLQQLLPGDRGHRARRRGAATRRWWRPSAPSTTSTGRWSVQYGIWMGKVLRGDLGESLRNKIPVTELLASKLPVTVELAICSMLDRAR